MYRNVEKPNVRDEHDEQITIKEQSSEMTWNGAYALWPRKSCTQRTEHVRHSICSLLWCFPTVGRLKISQNTVRVCWSSPKLGLSIKSCPVILCWTLLVTPVVDPCTTLVYWNAASCSVGHKWFLKGEVRIWLLRVGLKTVRVWFTVFLSTCSEQKLWQHFLGKFLSLQSHNFRSVRAF